MRKDRLASDVCDHFMLHTQHKFVLQSIMEFGESNQPVTCLSEQIYFLDGSNMSKKDSLELSCKNIKRSSLRDVNLKHYSMKYLG